MSALYGKMKNKCMEMGTPSILSDVVVDHIHNLERGNETGILIDLSEEMT
jgi:hypothetical protein